MGLYKKFVLPKLINWACQQNPTMRQREKVIPLAYGKVLEIGIGTGLNLAYYRPQEIQHLTGIDPSEENWNLKKKNGIQPDFDVRFLKVNAEDMPFNNNHFDTAVITYTLCSIKEPESSLEEIKRVLKPSGQLIFCEHGIAPDKKVEKWQHTLNPLWRTLSGGCNLNRNIPDILEKGGFKIKTLDTMYLPGWRPGSYNYWGTAYIR